MPGRLVMDVKEPQGLIGLKRDGSHLSQPSEGPQPKRVATPHNIAPLKVNGVQPPSKDDTALAATQVFTNGASHDEANHETRGDVGEDPSPPALEQFRDTLVPFGTMLERLAQFAYFQLSEMIESLADVDVRQTPQLTNGVAVQQPPDKSQESVSKKMRLLNFAQENKDRFIKALVISDWARNMGDMAQLIDVSMMLRKVDWATLTTTDSLWRLKENMIAAKMPNPNIEGALELLSTGKASWLPSLEYIPPKPLTAHELLETLTEMNFALSGRLNLHEHLPPMLTKFSIANGRATFSVEGEFEVDLAIADEDPATPFYFIDIRFTFSPSSPLSSDRLRNQVEAQANHALATSGLAGCYDLIHNFVLSHKLNILRCQALELARGKWVDEIEVQSVHRSLIVRYWCKQGGGGKNWIELGISRTQSGSSSASTSSIACRWFRRGQEVSEHGLEFNFNDLSMEAILEQVTGKHSLGKLSALLDSLGKLAPGSKHFDMSTILDSAAIDGHVLSLQVRPSRTRIRIMVDSISGSYTISPPGKDTAEMQSRLNADLQSNHALVVRNFACRMLLNDVRAQASTVGYSSILIDQKRMPASLTEREPAAIGVFERTSWESESELNENCGIAACVDITSGITWHLVRLGTGNDGRFIQSSELLSLAEGISRSVDSTSLLAVESEAVRVASRTSVSTKARLGCVESQATIQEHPAQSEASIRGRRQSLYVRSLDTHNDFEQPGAVNTSVFERFGDLLINPQIDDDDSGGFRYIYRTKLKWSHDDGKLNGLLRRSVQGEREVYIGPLGEVGVSTKVSLGTDPVPFFQVHLHNITRLRGLIAVVVGNHYNLCKSSLKELTFQYSRSYTCTYRLSPSPSEAKIELGVRGSPSPDVATPQARIIHQLCSLFTSDSDEVMDISRESHSFRKLCQLLKASLALFETASSLEATEPAGTVFLSCHTPEVFRVAYKAPLPAVSLNISAKPRQGKLYWVLRVLNPQVLNDKCKMSIALVLRDKGPGWEGLRNMAMATADGIGALLRQMDGAIRNPEGNISEAQSRAGGAAAAVLAAAAQQKAAAASGTNRQPQPQQGQKGRPPQRPSNGKEVVVLD